MMRTFMSLFGASAPVLLRLMGAPQVRAQEAATVSLAFEVASVKASKQGGGVRGGCHGVDSRYGPNEIAAAPPLAGA